MNSSIVCLLVLVVCGVTNCLAGSYAKPEKSLYNSTRLTRPSPPSTTTQATANNTLKTRHGRKKTNIPYQTTRRQFIPGLLARYQQFSNDQYEPYQDEQDESKNINFINHCLVFFKSLVSMSMIL